MKRTLKTLPNGLSVVVVEDHFAPVVAMNLWVNVGSADELPHQAGLAHVHEHMVFKGTAKRPVGKIAAEIEGAGGELNAFTSHDHTCYYITIAGRYFNIGLDVLADTIQNAAFDPAELEREISVILEEMARGNDSPMHKLSEAVFDKAFQKHPYGQPIIGDPKVLHTLRRKDVLGFFKRHYRPSNMVLVIVGDVKTDSAIRLVQKKFGQMNGPKYRKAKRPAEPAQKLFRYTSSFEPMAESICNLLFPAPRLFDDMAPAVEVLTMILGSGESSRLHHRLWEVEGAAFQNWASPFLSKDPGVIMTSFSTNPDKLETAFRSACDEIFRLRIAPPSLDEIDKVKGMIESANLFELETYEGRAKKLGYAMCMSGDPDMDREYMTKIASVSQDQLLQAARKYLTFNQTTCGIIAPREFKKHVSKKLLQGIIKETYDKYKIDTHVVFDEQKPPKPKSLAPHLKCRSTKHPKKIVLDNGLRLLFACNPSAPVFSLRAAALGGIRIEPKPGISAFTAAMFNKGIKGKNALEIAQTVDAMGGQLSGFSGQNTLGVSADFLTRDWEQGVDLALDCMLRPTFPQGPIDRVRDEILFDLKRREDRLSSKVIDLFSATLFKTHPFGITAPETIKSVQNISATQMKKFWKQSTSPDRMTIGISGDINPGIVAKKIESRMKHLKNTAPKKSPKPEKPPKSPQFVQLLKQKEQAHILLGFLGVSMSSPERHAVEVMMSVMSGQGGRLFVQLRDKQHLAYAVSGFHVESLETGAIGFYIATGQNNVETAIQGLETQVERLRKKKIGARELQRAKQYLIGSFEIDLQNNGAVAQQIALSELYGLGYRSYEKFPKQMEKVTAEQIRNVAKKYLDMSKSVLAVIRSGNGNGNC